MADKKIIRNSTAEFLIFTSQAEDENIEVRVFDENVWLSQKMIAKLFNVKIPAISKHLKNIFEENELNKEVVISILENTTLHGAIDSKTQTNKVKFYSLEAVIAVGFRINSQKAVDFRRWANQVLKDFSLKGYVIDDIRLKNGSYLNKDYFKDLILQIRDIRESERNFYQQITDIYATAIDYDLESKTTKDFFATVQNKMHYATHGNTAAELIVSRASYEKENMGLTSWKNAPNGKIIKSDVVIAKNYLSEKEIKALNRIVTMYLDYAEDQAEKTIPMTMIDWSKKLNVFLQFNEREVLENAGKVSAEIAKAFAESEFEKYKVIQDKNYQSDFDKLLIKELQERYKVEK